MIQAGDYSMQFQANQEITYIYASIIIRAYQSKLADGDISA